MVAVTKIRTQKLFLGLMVLVYFSLNTQIISIPGASLIRWLLPIVLLVITKIKNFRVPAFLLWIIIALIPSLFISIDFTTSIEKIVSFLLIFFCMLIFFDNSIRKENLDTYLLIYARIVVFFQIMNILFILTGQGMESDRAVGITTNANTLGVYSNIAFWSSILLMENSRNQFWKITYALIMFSSVYSSLLSGSRSAFVVMVINILLYAYTRYRKSLLFFPVCLFVIVGSYFLLSGKLSNVNIIALQRFQELGTGRDDLWSSGIEIWYRRKYFGSGFATSNLLNTHVGLQFHNSYLSFLIDCGLWGVIFCAIGFIQLCIGFFRSLSISQNSNLLRDKYFFTACAIMLNLTITACGESFLFAVGSTEGFSFWFLLAWSLIYLKFIPDK